MKIRIKKRQISKNFYGRQRLVKHSVIFQCNNNFVHISFCKVIKKIIGEEEMQVPNDKKSELYDILNKFVFTNRLDKYEEYKRAIKSISVPFYEYFLKNWENCKEM